MRVSKEPLAPLRSWKEFFLGERALRLKKAHRAQRTSAVLLTQMTHATAAE
jgi:hypothetical protein